MGKENMLDDAEGGCGNSYQGLQIHVDADSGRGRVMHKRLALLWRIFDILEEMPASKLREVLAIVKEMRGT